VIATIKRYYHRFSSPKHFYHLSGAMLPWFWGLAVLALLVGSVWGLAFAPPDYQQGNSYRIIFIHVPAAKLAFSIYGLMALAGVIILIWKIKVAEMVIKSCATLGASFTFITLMSGSVWGIPTWGTWWVWDARLTSMLILLFLFLGVIALQSAIANERSAAKAAAVFSLVGVVNLPIIKYSVDWWNTLHQPASFTLTQRPAMPPDMWIPLLVMVAGFYCLFAALLIMQTRCEILQRERKSSWVCDLVKEQ
jgi:heme exporter protein C